MIVAAPGAGKWLRVLGYVINQTAQVLIWKSATTEKGRVSQASVVAPVSPNEGWFDCGVNEALNLNLPGTPAVV